MLVAAVGPATADALRRAGVEPDLVPAEHSARGLVEAFPTPGARLPACPLPERRPGAGDHPRGLGRKGWEVRTASRPTAQCACAVPEPALLDQVAAADALTFTAPSACTRSWPAHAGGRPLPPPAHVVCIGPTTAAAARAAGLENVREAWGASAQGIVDELIAALGPGADDGP